jgi:LysR family glycine cleavage system transcriptional activator
MSREVPPFPAVRALEAAARHLRFKDAEKALHVTHSAVSHQVKALEEFVRTALVRRESRGVTFIREGSVPLCRRIGSGGE